MQNERNECILRIFVHLIFNHLYAYMLKELRVVLLFVFSLFINEIHGERFHFRTVGSLQGLSQTSAISIWQDDLGRMWFGNDALNCYNGESTKVYRVSTYFPGLEDSNIHEICGGDSVLYFLAEESVIEIDLVTERFVNPDIKAVSVGTRNNQLFYTSLEGDLYAYIREAGKSELLFSLQAEGALIYSFVIDSGHVFWLGTSKGLYKVDVKTGKILSVYFENDQINAIYKDTNGNMWVSGRSKPIRVVRPDGHVSTLVYENRVNTPFENEAYCFTEDSKGAIWLGTLNGIYQVIPPRRELPAYVLDDVFMPEFSIYALHTDKQGTIWIGPYYGEVRYFNPETDNYSLYSSDEKKPNHLRGVVLGEIVEDREGYMYVASEGSGVNVISPDRTQIRHITVASHRLPHDKIRSLYYDTESDRLYIGTYMESLVYYDRKTDRIYPVEDKLLTSRHERIIEEIIPYNDCLILLTQDGLFKMDRKTTLVTPLFADEKLTELSAGISRTIYLDDRNVLWVSSLNSGLFTVDMRTGKVLSFYGDGLSEGSVIPSTVNYICGNSKQGLFFSTLRSGALMYDVETDQFTNFSAKDNLLLSDICYKVALSGYGSLIVTSNKGVSMLNLSGRRTVYSSSHIRLDRTSPIMSLSPDCGLYISPRNRLIYVGGLQTLISFDEKDITTFKRNYSLYISSIQVNNAPIESYPSLINESPSRTKEIVLSHNRNTVNITFASSNYLSSYYTGYEYKMEGLSRLEDWTLTDHRTVSFTSLPAGTYLFTVRETTDPEKQVSLTIVVKPPFWKSYPAYFIYLILIGLLLWLFVRSSKARAVLHASLEFQQREAKRVLEENRNKLNFFGDISNEFRTPLTLIITGLDRLLNDFESIPKSKLEKIKRQAARMQGLFVELQEFREAENGILRLKVGYYSLTQLMEDIYTTGSDYESTLQVSFRYYHPGEDVKVWFDWAQMQKVMYNLLFAISKLVRVKGHIDITLHQKPSRVEVQMSCVGEVYDEEVLSQLFYVFDNSGQVSDAQDMSKPLPNNTIGLAFSRKIVLMHKGELIVRTEKERTSFIVSLQTGEKHFSPEEKTGSTQISLLPQPAFLDLPELAVNTPFASNETDGQPEKKYKILLIDSDDEFRGVLKDAFSSVYETLEASGAKDALELAVKEQPDIIISEISLSGASGVELCNTLKTNLGTLHIPVLLITTHPSVKQQNESVRAGADEYLVKPFSMEYLFLRCNSIVKNRANMQQKFTGRADDEVQGLATNSSDQRFLDKAILVLEKNIEDIGFDTVKWSKELGIGRTRLFDRIKHITGMTPNDYLLYIKMNKAMTLLRDNEGYTVGEVAYKLGFSSPAYFSKCFKKQIGITPQLYKKK